jgi:hypothetical protein
LKFACRVIPRKWEPQGAETGDRDFLLKRHLSNSSL